MDIKNIKNFSLLAPCNGSETSGREMVRRNYVTVNLHSSCWKSSCWNSDCLLFWRYPNFLIMQHGINHGKPMCQQADQCVQAFCYNTDLWQTQIDCQHSIARVMSLRELSGNIDKMTAYNQIRPLETTEAGFHSDQLPFLLFNQHPQITEQKSKYWQQPGKTSSGLHSFVVQQVTKGRNVKLHASSLMPVLTQFSLLTWTINKQLTQCCHVGRKAV